MTKKDLIEKMGVSEETLNDVIKSCGYTDVKNFNAVHENVMKSFIKKADIKVYPSTQEKTQIDIKETTKEKKTDIVSDEVEQVEVVTVVRKELIELISRAYHKGIEAGKNSIFIADKNRLEEIFKEAING